MASRHVKQMKDALDRCGEARGDDPPRVQDAEKAFGEAVVASEAVAFDGAEGLTSKELSDYYALMRRLSTAGQWRL